MIGFTSLDKREERTLLKYLQMNASDTTNTPHSDKGEHNENKDSLRLSSTFSGAAWRFDGGRNAGAVTADARSARAADAVAPGAATKEGILTGSHWGRFAPRWLTVDLWRQNRLNRINTRPK